VLDEIKRAFRALNTPVGNLRQIAAQALQRGEFASAEARGLLEFFQSGSRGFARPRRHATDAQHDDDP
jgi:hypothetical protein